ncbi:PTS sugar transporter subunit IIB [Vibrio sonorensis]|uniref:PTS sugar transporter subunit IIB n=1 Tax=Vibrio sonorensis TaxID=1004316 RepID=UPI0008D91880|nr:hypothetical protein [Vibrio sonorensis]
MNQLFDYHLEHKVGDRQIVAVVCAGGMTSSMLTQRMQKHFDELNMPYYAMYASIQALIDPDFHALYLDKLAMVFTSPQVAHYHDQAKAAMKSIPVEKIEPRVFGTMDYQKVVSIVQEVLESPSIKTA